ncbi:MAE_28990/MAE_18760 family HEPN-like nuclease [Desulfomonile tiedjei]|uniref:RiboL-PSP-HEPN domain-containing protein n=1 Tax=Desulfomonile tiedjei (strain ATCC 49306 / DSM 6799 / DCB-1) TaxID=706587 RepID=I4C725_DESTA|nr:MAE_28990/MAE_18760 family HEPN-like nuclease [Desulfomonile tiedjei]AFM25366.1 hypothetical protein Desti_2687 [Desulfomonile tiedjei DSM 6799]
MRSTLDAFWADIKELQLFVRSISGVYRTLAQHEDAMIRACLNIRRRLDYTAFIIALYTALEKFVDDLAWSYTELESSRNQYSDLCDKLRLKHLQQSAALLRRRRLGEGRYTGLSATDVVENLHACLSGKNPYKLNRHAVVHHDYNLRSQVVQDVFGSLGIENINKLASGVKTMIDWFCTSEGIESSSIQPISPKVVDLRLNDLVDRRNQIAHAGAGRDLSESLDTNEMQVRLDFLEAYARSLFDVIISAYLDRYYIRSGLAISIGHPLEGPFKGGSVVVVRKPPCRIFRGQPIIKVSGGRVDSWGQILEIQVSDVGVDSIEPDSDVTDAGLRADLKFTKGNELFVLENKDVIIWG